MKYLRAIFSTLALIITPLIILPILKWYEQKFSIEPTGVYMILIFLGFGGFIMTIFNWVSAIRNKTYKELFD